MEDKVVKRVGFYEIDTTIGRGNFAVVKLARHKTTKSQVAIKMIDKKQLDESNLEKVYREVKILKMLDHPNIIKLYQVMESEQFLYLVSEYAPNGEIFDYIAKNGKMSESDARKMFWQIICAVDYCHKKGIVHRDLKAENLLLGVDMNIKIADFGFGNFFKPGLELSTWCGSPPYAAPEVFEGRRYYGPEVDVWSLGVVLYVLVCGALPFDGENLHALRDRVVSGRFRIPFFMSSDCENLIRRMLVVDLKRRISIAQIKQHRWMASIYSREELILRLHDFDISDPERPHNPENVTYNEHVLNVMQKARIDRQRTIESLETEAYDNFSAIYNLLLDKLKQQSRKYLSELGRVNSEASPRRPSTIADQAMIFSGQRPPILADTKQGPFSQTTDCIQLHEVPGALCQRQQMIYTDQCMGWPLLPRVPRGRIFGQGSVVRAIATSIDEGVETDYDEDADSSRDPSMGSQAAAAIATTGSDAVGFLTRADMFGCFGHVNLPNQPSGVSPASFDSTIELDVLSNVSSSPSGSITATGMTAEGNETVECSCEGAEDDTAEDQKEQRSFVDFREGRRASDGLMVRGALEFQQQLKKSMKTRGVAELRKELEKLQLEASGDSETRYRTRHGRFLDVRSLQQRSLEENVTSFRGSNLVIKRTSLPFVGYCTLALQKRLVLRHGLQTSPCFDSSHASTFAQDPDMIRGSVVTQHVPVLKPIKPQQVHMLPICSSTNRQSWLLQHTAKPPVHQMPTFLQQPQEYGDEAGSAKLGLLASAHGREDCSAPSVAMPFRSISPCFPPRNSDVSSVNAGLPSSERFPLSSSNVPGGSHLVPTCRSQDNLSDYTLNADVLQSKDSASLGTLLNHPTYSGATTTAAAVAEPPDPGATRRHMVRRTLYRMIQQETLVSPPCEEDVDEFGLGVSEAEGSSNGKADPATSMDIS